MELSRPMERENLPERKNSMNKNLRGSQALMYDKLFRGHGTGHGVRAECGTGRLEIPEAFLLFLFLSPYSFSLDMNKVFI